MFLKSLEKVLGMGINNYGKIWQVPNQKKLQIKNCKRQCKIANWQTFIEKH